MVSSHHPSLGRTKPKWNLEGDWDNKWCLQGKAKGVRVVQCWSAEVRALLSVAAAEEGYSIKERKSLVDRMIRNCHAIHLRWKRGLWVLEQWVLQDLGLGQQCQVPFCNLYTEGTECGAVKVGSGCSDHLQSYMLPEYH